MQQDHLSPQAHQRLHEELDERSGPRRREISEKIERARELGDISENGDYDADTTAYLVGSIEERHETYDVLSTGSPLGQALLGKGPGDVVTYEAPKRTFQVEIVSVHLLSCRRHATP